MTAPETPAELIANPRTLSLFSGGGGLDIGFALAGFNIIAAVEIQPECCETLRRNEGTYFPQDAQVFNIDIHDFDTSQVVGPVDFIIGGPPCQTFSAIGRRAGGAEGTNDPRGGLFQEYCRIVAHYRPRGFLFENVRGIISSNKGTDWREIKAAFRAIGYELNYKILNAADFGVAQKRERLIMVGTRDGFRFDFPRPTHGPDSGAGIPHIGALAAMADIQDPNEPFHSYDGKYGHLLEQVPPGQNYHHFTIEMGYPNPIFAWRSRFSDFLYKADPEEPVRTVVAKLGKYSGPFHWKNRRFTLDEMKRLQSFPDDYFIEGTMAQKLQQIGNSVPPVFAERLARAVLQSVFGIAQGMETIDGEFKFSYDAAKGVRARRTRALRLETATPLFDGPVEVDHSNDYVLRTHFSYESPSKLTFGNSGTPVEFTRDGDTCTVRVGSGTETIRYELTFDRPVGAGLSKIVCVSSLAGERLYMAWDAVEEALKRNTSFQTMFDIYGHFTEPHPIFTLATTVYDQQDPLLLLSKHCSKPANCRQVLHYRDLERISGLPVEDSETFLTYVKYMRALRLDVRVHQTNPRIPEDHFTMNYPFTLSRSRQVAVTWTEKEAVVM
ncbi:hypothetical protein CBQ26_15050 [Deinococcus indicus]|uniref:Cytosine-specific methyltransferase n=1 Tax=Deinococcus indicus TaxID=223556 RepID=A0A246BHF2_9DEIO|nr:DNA cytosine methyltransferase [Deinococcus indicus]OWL94610.1 hypothetical protein CBQ26_15050 [Deinococcus indicus]